MGLLKLLIVDDIEDNRLILKAICRKMEGFEIKEACDGLEAVELCDQWNPHIILMDIMMPRLDGYQASKIIKERHPKSVIIVTSAIIDPQMETKMASIGVTAYVHKPIDKELLRFKLQSFGALLHSREGEFTNVSVKEAMNLFSLDVRHFKTIFDITDAEGMMDFGLWVLGRTESNLMNSCPKIDGAVEFLYEMMRQGLREEKRVSIIVEENFEEIFITMKFENKIELKPKSVILFQELGEQCSVQKNIACLRLRIHEKAKISTPKPPIVLEKPIIVVPEPKPMVIEPEVPKEIKVLETKEKEMLRQSFVQKTSAIEYIHEIGGDVLDEIRDLESLDEEWIEKLHALDGNPSEENIRQFADGVLGVYVRAINNLFEFTALAYALSSLGSFLKEHSEIIVSDPSKLKTLVMLMEHLGADLTAWRDHIFGLQDTADIHYLDSSFFSSCMQIEQIIGNKEVASDDDDDDGMEFF